LKHIRIRNCCFAGTHKVWPLFFSPGDHHGVWAMQREGIKGKGILPKYALEIVEQIAKEKALA
jgi:hypothetical protein